MTVWINDNTWRPQPWCPDNTYNPWGNPWNPQPYRPYEPYEPYKPYTPYIFPPLEPTRQRAPVRRVKRKVRAPIRRTKMARGKKETFITLVLDRSGSMCGCHQAALDALNEQINSIKKHAKKGGRTYVSLLLFDDTIDIVFENVPAEDITPLEMADYALGGSTALRDAMVTAIETMEEKQSFKKNQGFLVILISDGQENSSGTPNGVLQARIKELEGTDRWTFTYMLDGHSWEQAMGFAVATGVSLGNVSVYTASPIGTIKAGNAMRSATVNYLADREEGKTSSQTFYNSGDGTESRVKE